mmetsp:Transcript_39769/g.89059  ORF Transcript_39769/g.89059 Transcript_39769/m.89059 type:complete len:389 (-) Transcript_39769:1566-2732(-)
MVADRLGGHLILAPSPATSRRPARSSRQVPGPPSGAPSERAVFAAARRVGRAVRLCRREGGRGQDLVDGRARGLPRRPRLQDAGRVDGPGALVGRRAGRAPERGHGRARAGGDRGVRREPGRPGGGLGGRHGRPHRRHRRLRPDGGGRGDRRDRGRRLCGSPRADRPYQYPQGAAAGHRRAGGVESGVGRGQERAVRPGDDRHGADGPHLAAPRRPGLPRQLLGQTGRAPQAARRRPRSGRRNARFGREEAHLEAGRGGVCDRPLPVRRRRAQGLVSGRREDRVRRRGHAHPTGRARDPAAGGRPRRGGHRRQAPRGQPGAGRKGGCGQRQGAHVKHPQGAGGRAHAGDQAGLPPHPAGPHPGPAPRLRHQRRGGAALPRDGGLFGKV